MGDGMRSQLRFKLVHVGFQLLDLALAHARTLLRCISLLMAQGRRLSALQRTRQECE